MENEQEKQHHVKGHTGRMAEATEAVHEPDHDPDHERVHAD